MLAFSVYVPNGDMITGYYNQETKDFSVLWQGEWETFASMDQLIEFFAGEDQNV